ncbi:MAG: hypothetical protein WC007_14190 [Pelobacteraceae bacterium]
MKKSLLAKLGMLLLIISTLSACLLVPVEEGRRDGHQGRDRGEHRGDRGDRH